MENWCIWEGISLMNLAESVSCQHAVFCYQVLNAVQIMVCLKKIINAEMSFRKDTEKIVLLKVKGMIHIVKFRTRKKCIFLSSATSDSHPLEQ